MAKGTLERELKNKWYEANSEYVKDLIRKWRVAHPDIIHKHRRKRIDTLPDSLVKEYLKQQNILITPETIEMKRQQIIAKRTLKEFKKWRKEYESNHTDVSGKQLKNEVNYEGQLQAG